MAAFSTQQLIEDIARSLSAEQFDAAVGRSLAAFDALNGTLGPASVLVQGRLSASPTFSPDGQTIAFLAPVQQGGTFQLWTVPAAVSPSPSPARPITQNLGLDAVAVPVWDTRER